MRQLARSTLLMCLLAGLASVAFADSYTYTSIKLPSTFGTFVSVGGINDAGAIVGTYYDSAGVMRGFLDSGGIFTSITDPLASPAGGGTEAVGINNLGEIVGTYFDAQGAPYGFLDNGGIFTTISEGYPTGINDAGQIVGNAGAYGPPSIFYGINDEGQLVGTYMEQGVLSSGGTLTTIEDPADEFTALTGINNTGQIVGYGGLAAVYEGFLYSGGIFTTINPPFDTGYEGDEFLERALAINDMGQITGEYYDYYGHLEGFVATPAAASPEPSPAEMVFSASILMIGWRARERLSLCWPSRNSRHLASHSDEA